MSANTLPFSPPRLTDFPPGYRLAMSPPTRACASVCSPSVNRQIPSPGRMTSRARSRGRKSSFLGPRETTSVHCTSVPPACPALNSTVRFEARPGLTTLPWFRSPGRTPSNEVHSHRHLRPRCLRRAGPWRRRGLGACGPRNWGSSAISRLGPARLSHGGASTRRFPSTFSPCRSLAYRLGPVGLSSHRLVLRYAHGVPAPSCLYPPSLFGRPSVPHSRGLAQLCLVRDEFRILCLPLWHPPAPHLQRKTLLVSRDALRRHSLWPLRESQPLCRIHRARHPCFSRSFGLRKGAQGTLVSG